MKRNYIGELKEVLRVLHRFRGARTAFIKKYNKKTGQQQKNNFVAKIMSEIDFSRSQLINIDDAINIAYEVYNDYKEKREKNRDAPGWFDAAEYPPSCHLSVFSELRAAVLARPLLQRDALGHKFGLG